MIYGMQQRKEPPLIVQVRLAITLPLALMSQDLGRNDDFRNLEGSLTGDYYRVRGTTTGEQGDILLTTLLTY